LRQTIHGRQGTIAAIPFIGIAAVLLLVIGVVWCFFFRSSDADVRGLVTLDGQPVPSAVVVFISENAKTESTITAQSDKDGNYRLIGNTGLASLRTYKVAVTQQTLKGGKVPERNELEQARSKGCCRMPCPRSTRIARLRRCNSTSAREQHHQFGAEEALRQPPSVFFPCHSARR